MHRRIMPGKALATCLFVLVGSLFSTLAYPGQGLSGKLPTPPKGNRPWLMVSMGMDGSCSKSCRNAFSVVQSMVKDHKGVIMPFSKVTAEKVAELDPAFIVLGPQGTPWCRYGGASGVDLQNFLWMLPHVVEGLKVPVLGICGGHQALALAFGGKVGPIRGVSDDCFPYSRVKQGGVVNIVRESPDPIFRGLEPELRILQSHYDEVKSMPPDFVLLASDPLTRIQIMRHRSKPVYGIQGHPEYFNNARPDGGVFIRNFIDIATTYNRVKRVSELESLDVLPSFRESFSELQGPTAKLPRPE
jgi:GMP synthase (glutamine-hydrolysing)